MMLRINNIEFPYEVIDGLIKGGLVVFAGAGISVDDPSNLPLFNNLALQIKHYKTKIPVDIKPTDDELQKLKDTPIPIYLEELEELHHVKVHETAKKLLTHSGSKPNQWHKAIVNLFKGSKEIKIVTTNFDLHLSSILTPEEVMNNPIYIAPALPRGDDFKGFVYLHGNVSQDSKELVLTDRDFSRSYIKYGRQTSFLRELFSKSTILFIGYSHGDVILNYIAKSDEFETGRFILTDNNDDKYWGSLGINPIYYAKNNHIEALCALEDLGKVVQRTFLENEDEIKRLVSKSTSDLKIDEESYLKWSLVNPAKSAVFIKYAKELDWLLWTIKHGFLDCIFNVNEESSENRSIFARWFGSELFVGKYDSECHKIISAFGIHRVTRDLNVTIALTLSRLPELPPKEILAQWVLILCESSYGNQQNISDYIMMILKKLRFPEDQNTALILFDFLCKPRVGYQSIFSGTQMGIYFLGDKIHLEWFYNEYIRSNSDCLFTRLYYIIIRNLIEYTTISESINKDDVSSCLISYNRKAIEDHSQNNIISDGNSMLDMLINIARDLIEYVFRINSKKGLIFCLDMIHVNNPILERIAVHGIRVSSLTVKQKLKEVLLNNFLYSGSKHEVFTLIKSIYPMLSSADRKRLIRKIQKGSSSIEKDYRLFNYEIYNFLYWLTLCDPECEKARSSFSEFSKLNPDFRPRDHPDFDTYIEVGYGVQSPISIDDLLSKDPSDFEFQNWFINFKGGGFNQPDRSGLLQTLQGAVGKDFEWGLTFAIALIDSNNFNNNIAECIFYGWKYARPNTINWIKLLQFIKKYLEFFSGSLRSLTDLLKSCMTHDSNNIISDELVDQVTEIALEFIPDAFRLEDESMLGEQFDWYANAINSTGGHIVEILIRALEIRNQPQHQCSDEDLNKCFRHFLNNRNYASDMGCVILGSNLYYLYRLNKIWTKNNLIPLFVWSNNYELAEKVWSGYLNNFRCDISMFKDLLKIQIEAASFIVSHKKMLKQFTKLVANMSICGVVFGLEDPIGSEWSIDFIKRVDDQSRIEFAFHIRQMIKYNEQVKIYIDQLCKEYLIVYWGMRHAGIPAPITQQETLELIQWLPFLGTHFEQGVDIVLDTNKELLAFRGHQHTNIYDDLNNEQILLRYPEKTLILLRHLIINESFNNIYADQIRALLGKLKAKECNSSYMSDICNKLASMGYEFAREFV
jgi:hypothetical protein